MAHHNAGRRYAADLRRFDKLFALQAQRLAAHDTRHIEPGDHADSDKDQQDILSEEGHQQDHKEHEREGVEDLQQAHHHRVDFATQIARERAVERADHDRHQRGGNADHQGDASTDSDTHQQITPRGVGAEVVAGGHIRRVRHHAPVGIEIGKLRQQRRKGDEQRDQHQYDKAGNGGAVVHKATTRILPQATPFNFQFLTEVFQRLAVFLT